MGTLLVFAAAVMGLVGLWLFSPGSSIAYALVGVSAIPFLMAYLYRHGRGEYCEAVDGGGQTCTDLPWGPWGFVVAGVAFVVGGMLLGRIQRRDRPRSNQGPTWAPPTESPVR